MLRKNLQTLGLVVIWLSLTAMPLAGCSVSQPSVDQVFTPPAFSVMLEVNADQETHGSLTVTNLGDTVFPEQDDFNAEMNLWDETSAPRSKIEAFTIQEIQPKETVFLSSGYWHLDPGVYFLTWGSPKYGGSITVFSVVEEAERLYLGESQSFRTKPALYSVHAAYAGRVETFTLEKNGKLVIQGETPISDQGRVCPLLFDQDGLINGFPTGQCVPVTDGHWQLQIPPDSAGSPIDIQPNTSYRVILFSDNLTVPPSAPFEVLISPPPEYNE